MRVPTNKTPIPSQPERPKVDPVFIDMALAVQADLEKEKANGKEPSSR